MKKEKKKKKLLTSTEDSVVQYIDEGSLRLLAFPVSMQSTGPRRLVDMGGLTLGDQITIFRHTIGLERLSKVETGAPLSNRKEIFGPPLPHKLSQVCPYKGQDC